MSSIRSVRLSARTEELAEFRAGPGRGEAPRGALSGHHRPGDGAGRPAVPGRAALSVAPAGGGLRRPGLSPARRQDRRRGVAAACRSARSASAPSWPAGRGQDGALYGLGAIVMALVARLARRHRHAAALAEKQGRKPWPCSRTGHRARLPGGGRRKSGDAQCAALCLPPRQAHRRAGRHALRHAAARGPAMGRGGRPDARGSAPAGRGGRRPPRRRRRRRSPASRPPSISARARAATSCIKLMAEDRSISRPGARRLVEQAKVRGRWSRPSPARPAASCASRSPSCRAP